MKKVTKPIVALLTVSAILATAVPVLAATTGNASSSPAGTLKAIYQTGMKGLKDLRAQDKQLLDQISALRQELTGKKPYLGLGNRQDFKQAISSDTQQIKTDRQAKNGDALQQDFTKLQNDLNSRITADQNVINVLNTVKASGVDFAQLRAQEKQVVTQIQSVRQEIKSKLQADRTAKNKSALKAAKNDLALAKNANQTAGAISLKTDVQQLRTDAQTGKTDAVSRDLTKLSTDFQAKIKADQALLAALQKVDQDL